MHVVTDDERRDVARKLREIRPCKSGHIKWWEIARALGLKQPAGWFGWEKFEPDSANRLADLIEPGDMLYVTYSRSTCGPNGMAYMVKVRHRARGLERDFYAVDLKKLLEVLDEMEITVKCAGPDVPRDYVENWANEVREALGEVVA